MEREEYLSEAQTAWLLGFNYREIPNRLKQGNLDGMLWKGKTLISVKSVKRCFNRNVSTMDMAI